MGFAALGFTSFLFIMHKMFIKAHLYDGKTRFFALGWAIWSLKNFILCMQLASLTQKRRDFAM